MALFQKKPTVTSSAPAYTIGATKALLIVGLGNPESKYDGTRHNIGFQVIDYFAKANRFPAWTEKKDLKAQISSSNLGDSRVIVVKPTTYMNNSGEAVQAVQRYFRIYNQNTLVVYDELAIPFGQLRTRLGGSDAGHNGVKSLISHMGEDFGRLRIGIGSETSKNADAAMFVLKKFNKEEQGLLSQILRESNALITEFIYGDGLPHETRHIL